MLALLGFLLSLHFVDGVVVVVVALVLFVLAAGVARG